MIFRIPDLSKNGIAAFVFVAVSCGALLASSDGGIGTTMLPGTVENFELPNFNDKTGLKEWELFGASATYVNDKRVDIEDIKLRVFDRNSRENAERVFISSPSAFVNPETRIAEGNSAINVKSRDFTMSGRKWRWNGDGSFVEVFESVKIDLTAPSGDVSAGGARRKPAHIESVYASLKYGGDTNIFTLRERVSVDNADMVLTCDEIEMETLKDSGGLEGIRVIKGAGNITLDTEKQTATSQRAVITPSTSVAVLEGSPSIVDVPSRARLGGAEIVLDRKNRTIVSRGSAAERASAVFYHSKNPSGKPQQITVRAEKITMKSLEHENTFECEGGVVVDGGDFTATGARVVACAENTGGRKPRVKSIVGTGSVSVSNQNGVARARRVEIDPSSEVITLVGNAVLTEPEKGVEMRAHRLLLERAKNRAEAFPDKTARNSFVEVDIMQAPNEAMLSGRTDSLKKHNKQTAGGGKSRIRAKKLVFENDGGEMTLAFSGNVSITSDVANAVCGRMEVLASGDGASGATIRRITAYDDVVVRCKNYTARAELAKIYPENSPEAVVSADGSRRAVELLTSPKFKNLRPSIILPPIGNIGLSSSASRKKPMPTVITSDVQWLSSGAKADTYVFDGNVKIRGTDLDGSCNRIELEMQPDSANGKRRLERITMTSEVKIIQGLKEVSCGRADIFAPQERVVLSQNPVVINHEDNTSAEGYRIVYDKGRRSLTVENDPSAPSADYDVTETPDDGSDGAERPRPKLVLPDIDKN